MNTTRIIALAAVVLLLFAASGGIFVVDETQQVIITQFGKPVGGAITSPGLHFKVPLLQEALFFDKRFLEWDGERNQVPTADKRFIWVDTYARWRITDPLLFYKRFTNERFAQTALDDIIDGATRDAVASHNLVELVRSTNRTAVTDTDLAESDVTNELDTIEMGRPGITSEIITTVAKRTSDLGLEVIDVRFKRIDYNEDVRQNVYERMIAERNRIAQQFRSEGLGDSARIRGEKERDLKQITSDAYRKSREIIGKADARATAISAEAYGRDPDFYQFLKTMETYETTLDKDSWIILSTDGEFYRYLKGGRR